MPSIESHKWKLAKHLLSSKHPLAHSQLLTCSIKNDDLVSAAVPAAAVESSALLCCGSNGESCSNVSLTLVEAFADESNVAIKHSST